MANQLFSAKVLTWGTDHSTVFKAIQGYNVGHAAIEIVMPISAETTAYIEQYINHTDIPVEKCVDEGCFKVYISIWPRNFGDRVYFSTLSKDYIDERMGVPVDVNPKRNRKNKVLSESEYDLFSILIDRARRPLKSPLGAVLRQPKREVVIKPLEHLEVNHAHRYHPISYGRGGKRTVTSVEDASKHYVELLRVEELMQSQIVEIYREELMPFKNKLLSSLLPELKTDDRKNKISKLINEAFDDFKKDKDPDLYQIHHFVEEIQDICTSLTEDEIVNARQYFDEVARYKIDFTIETTPHYANAIRDDIINEIREHTSSIIYRSWYAFKVSRCFARFNQKDYGDNSSYAALREEVTALVEGLPREARTPKLLDHVNKLGGLKKKVFSKIINRSFIHRLYSLVARKNEIENDTSNVRRGLIDHGFGEYCLVGKAPDHVTELPLDIMDSENGLNLEAMLKEARKIHDEKEGFSLYERNCSQAASRVLIAGLEDNAHIMKHHDMKVLVNKLKRMLSEPKEEEPGRLKIVKDKITEILQKFDKGLSFERVMKLFSPSQVHKDSEKIRDHRTRYKIIQLFLKIVEMIKRLLNINARLSHDNIMYLIDNGQYSQSLVEIKAMSWEDFIDVAKRKRLIAYILQNVSDDSSVDMIKHIVDQVPDGQDDLIQEILKSVMNTRPEFMGQFLDALNITEEQITGGSDEDGNDSLLDSAVFTQNSVVVSAFLEKLKDMDRKEKERMISKMLKNLFSFGTDYIGSGINYSYEFLLVLFSYTEDQRERVIQELMPCLFAAAATEDDECINNFLELCVEKGIAYEVFKRMMVTSIESRDITISKQVQYGLFSKLCELAKLKKLEARLVDILADYPNLCEHYYVNIQMTKKGAITLNDSRFLDRNTPSTVFSVLEGVEVISEDAFKSERYKVLKLPKSLQLIEQDAFLSMSNLASLQLPPGVTLRKHAIHNCKSLKSIYISPGSQVDEEFIAGSNSLEEIVIDGSCSFHKSAFDGISDAVKIIVLNEAAKKSLINDCPSLASRVVSTGKSAKMHTSGINIKGYADDMSSLYYEGVSALISENSYTNSYYNTVAELYGKVDDAEIKAVHERFSRDKLEVYLSKESSMLEISEALLALQSSSHISLFSYGQEEDLKILDMLALYGNYLEGCQLDKTIILTLSDGITRVIPLQALKGELEALESYKDTILEEIEEYYDCVSEPEDLVECDNSAKLDVNKVSEAYNAERLACSTSIYSAIVYYLQGGPQRLFQKKAEEVISSELENTDQTLYAGRLGDIVVFDSHEIKSDEVMIVGGGDVPSILESSTSKQAGLPKERYRCITSSLTLC